MFGDMKITLIEPAMIKHQGLSEKPMFCFQPLTLGLLAGITPPDIEVEVLDDRIDSIDFGEPTDLVGISVKTFTAHRAYEIAAEYRARGVKVVLGGYHPSLVPEESLAHADIVVIGEAESVWQNLLDDLGRHEVRRVYQGEREKKYPVGCIKRSVFATKKYIPMTMIETARGCPYRCSFCSVTTFFGHKYRQRTPESVLREIEEQGTRRVFFVDDNIVGDPDSAKALFRALIPLKVQWISQASISMTSDPELMDLMQKSGCAGVLVGLESIVPQSLKQIHKGWNTKQSYAASLHMVREHGIAMVGSFMIGLDHDTPESLAETLGFAIDQKMFAAMFNLLVPYPGTELYRDFERNGRLLYPHWWLDPGYAYGKVSFRPCHFSPNELAELRLELYRRFYDQRSVVRRMLDLEANSRDIWHLFSYLTLNLPAYRQELQRQGKLLGAEQGEDDHVVSNQP